MNRRRLLTRVAAIIDWAVGPVLVVIVVFFLGVIAGAWVL